MWNRPLPYIGSSPPTIYMANEEQFILFQSTGSTTLRGGYPSLVNFGDAVVAFKLKK